MQPYEVRLHDRQLLTYTTDAGIVIPRYNYVLCVLRSGGHP